MANITTSGFPLATIVDGILSYLQWAFSNPDIIPPEFRWDMDNRASKIRICAPFVIDDEKPMSAPYIIVERSSFSFSNSIIDNLKSKTPITGEESEHVDWMDGGINITFGSGVATEASNIANIVALLMQADRRGICGTLRFARSLKYVGISPEVPVVKHEEVHRWETTLQLSVSLQFGWISRQTELSPWDKADVINQKVQMYSDSGEMAQGSDLFVDNEKDFGPLNTNDPQLLSSELSKGWYYIRLSDNSNDQLYTVKEIVNNHTLRLATHDEDDLEVPWQAPSTSTGVEYDFLWNHIHLYAKIPSAN